MTSSEQENQKPEQPDISPAPETPQESGAETVSETAPVDGEEAATEQNVSAPEPVSAPQTESGDGKGAAHDSSPPQTPDWGNNPRKILQELEKECDSEKGKKTAPVSDTSSVPPGPETSPVLPGHPLSDDATADDLITEAMRELDVLIKQIRENP